MTTNEIIIMKALGEYEGREAMLREATEEIFSGVTNADEMDELNRWAERMHKRNRDILTRRIKEAE